MAWTFCNYIVNMSCFLDSNHNSYMDNTVCMCTSPTVIPLQVAGSVVLGLSVNNVSNYVYKLL